MEAILVESVEATAKWLDADGRLLDPVLEEPTQYGTPYFAHAAACVCKRRGGREDTLWSATLRAAHASLDLLLRVDAPAWISGVDRWTGAVSRLNHRDFFWPAVLAVRQIARQIDPIECNRLDRGISAVNIEAAFHARPPSNWAAVWLSGEWRRIRAGLSPFDLARFERWLAGMFEWIDVDRGFYREPGLPNAYDLFTRLHLLRLLDEGYDGAHADRLRRLAEAGLRRSLAVQLTDGSLAAGHRSAGQTWTLTAQSALFARSGRVVEGVDHAATHRAALAALSGLADARRDDGTLSPVHNALPANHRVGYEGYTADGHYTPLALSFLAEALEAGLDAADSGRVDGGLWIDRAPIWRAVAKHKGTSIQIRGGEANGYDGVGLTDVVFAYHALSWAGSAAAPCQKTARPLLNPGVAVAPLDGGRDRPASTAFTGTPTSLESPTENTLVLETVGDGFGEYRCSVEITRDGGIAIEEATPGRRGTVAWLLPYLSETGRGETTDVRVTRQAHDTVVALTHRGQMIHCRIRGRASRVVHLPTGLEGRRGRLGLVRVELFEPSERLSVELRPQATPNSPAL